MAYSYIKREEEQYIWNKVFAPSAEEDGECIALHGPNNIGKSYLLNHIIDEFKKTEHPNVYCFVVDLQDCKSCWEVWFNLFSDMKVALSRNKLESAPKSNGESVDSILEGIYFFANLDYLAAPVELTNRYVKYIFDTLRDIGIRIILVIDEFDMAASSNFVDRDRLFLQLFALSKKAKTKKNHSILLISRQSLKTIQGKEAVDGGSWLPDAYDKLGKTLSGFDDLQMEQYFTEYPGSLTIEQKRDIMYYCGRNPGLLESMHTWYCEKSPSSCIADVYASNTQGFSTAFSRMCDLMKREHVETGIRNFDVFLEEFIGPVTSDTHAEDIKDMRDYGFVTKVADDHSPYRMFDTTYEPLSPEFLQYVIAKELPKDVNRASALLVKAEVLFRLVLNKFGLHVYGSKEDWGIALDRRLEKVAKNPSLHVRFYDSYQRLCTENNAGERVVTGTKLDVVSISDLYNLAISFGPPLEALFTNLPGTQEETKEVFDFLTDCRNLEGHRNIRVLDSLHLKRLTEICEVLIRDFEKVLPEVLAKSPDVLKGMIQEVKTAEPLATSHELSDDEYAKAQALVGSIVIMTNLKRGTKRNIKGVVRGTNFNVSISALKAQDLPYVTLPVDIKVKLDKWDPNRQSPHFEASPILE